MANVDNDLEILPQYTPAIGQDGLADALNHLRQESDRDPEFARQDHYLLFRKDTNASTYESVIKADLSERPFQFWHFNTHFLPAIEVIKDTIKKFLESCGQTEPLEHSFHDLYFKIRQAKVEASITGEQWFLPDDPRAYAFEIVAKEKRPVTVAEDIKETAATFMPEAHAKVSNTWLSFWNRKEVKPSTQPADQLEQQKNSKLEKGK